MIINQKWTSWYIDKNIINTKGRDYILKQIGIACTNIFHYIHLKRIAIELRKNEMEVMFIIYTPRHVNGRFEKLEEYFQNNDINYCSFEEVFGNQISFDMIIAPYFLPGFQLLDNKIIKVRCLYGYAKDRWNYAEWNKGFDLILSYGPYAEKRLSKFSKVINIGHPRNRVNYKQEILDIQGKLFSRKLVKKPVVVYCPTWADLSSLNLFSTSLEKLKENYTVLIKLHHGNVLSDNKIKMDEFLKSEDVFIFDEQYDLFDLLSQCDAVISDHSGAIFDAMLFKKPIVLLDPYQNKVNTGFTNLQNMKNIAVYTKEKEDESNLESLDIKVRNILPHTQDINRLQDLIETSMKNEEVPYSGLLKELYSFNDSKAPKRAVNALKEILASTEIQSKDAKDFHILDDEKIDHFILRNKNDHLTIWGAGEIGQVLYSWITAKGFNISSIYDSDINKHGKLVQNTEVIPPQVKGKILITVASHQKEIISFLENAGLRSGEDFISVFRSVNSNENSQ